MKPVSFAAALLPRARVGRREENPTTTTPTPPPPPLPNAAAEPAAGGGGGELVPFVRKAVGRKIDTRPGADVARTPAQLALLRAGIRSPAVLIEFAEAPLDVVSFAIEQHATVNDRNSRAGRIVSMIRSGLAAELWRNQQAEAAALRTAAETRRAAEEELRRRQADERARIIDLGRRAVAKLDAEALKVRIAGYRDECPGSSRRFTNEQLLVRDSFLAWLGAAEERA